MARVLPQYSRHSPIRSIDGLMVRESLRHRFVIALESMGGSAGNGKLQDELGWQDDTYWGVHAALIEDRTITKGRGREVCERTSHSGFTIRIRITANDLSPAYLTHFLKSKVAQITLIESGDGANISSLNQQALAALPASVPSIGNQSEVVSELREIGDKTETLEAFYARKLDNLADLKQVILQKAFSGEPIAHPKKALPEAAE
jgi:hypothetical protein